MSEPVTMRSLRFFFLCIALTTILFVGGLRASERSGNFRLESFAIALDPAFIADTQSRRIVDMLHANLIRGTPDGKFLGELAQSWEWLDSRTVRFQLRKGMTFNGARPVTAADAAWSICRLLQPSAPSRWLFENIRHELNDDGKSARCVGLRSPASDILDIEVATDPGRLLSALAAPPAAIVPSQSEPGEYGVVDGAGPYEVEQIEPNARVVLRARPGGPVTPGFETATFRLIEDEAIAALLYRNGDLDVLEIANPMLFKLITPWIRDKPEHQIMSSTVDQIRLLIFNETGIADKLGISVADAHRWTRKLRAIVDVDSLAARFAPLLVPMRTSYFPGQYATGPVADEGEVIEPSRRLEVISENDPFSDQITSAIINAVGNNKLDYTGLEKSVLINRLIQRQYDIASVTLEALVHHPAYWLSFFRPGSPFTIFGKPIEGLMDPDEIGASEHNRMLIDTQGNWLVFAQEKRVVVAQPHISGLTLHPTGLLDYSMVKSRR